MSDREQRVIVPLDASHPELGRWLWAMEDTRARTIRIAVPNDSAPQPFQLPGQDTVTPPVFTVPVVPIRP